MGGKMGAGARLVGWKPAVCSVRQSRSLNIRKAPDCASGASGALEPRPRHQTGGDRSQDLLFLGKFVFADAAGRASPVSGDIFPFGAGRDTVIGIALFGVIDITADTAHILFHCCNPFYLFFCLLFIMIPLLFRYAFAARSSNFSPISLPISKHCSRSASVGIYLTFMPG